VNTKAVKREANCDAAAAGPATDAIGYWLLAVVYIGCCMLSIVYAHVYWLLLLAIRLLAIVYWLLFIGY
jgi:hypothetical protein